MNNKLTYGLIGLLVTGTAYAAEGLYSVGQEPEDGIPAAWHMGVDVTYDDNVMASATNEEDSFSINPYVGFGVVSISPQTLYNFYAKVGAIYYLDAPDQIDDWNSSSRLRFNIRHNFSERVSIASRNNLAYQLEENYNQGLATSRRSEESVTWRTDNYVAYRWTERMSTRTGIAYSGVEYDNSDNSNRQIVEGYHQFRYLLSPTSVLTAQYRYGETSADGLARDKTNQYLTVGMDHRFGPTTVAQFEVGAQLREIDGGDDSESPYAQASINSKVNGQLTVGAFLRYSTEDYDTVQFVNGALAEYDERETLRVGVNANYVISPKLTAYGGMNYIPTDFNGGRVIGTGANAATSSEDLFNTYIGLTLQITENVMGSATYNYTNSDSDFAARDYDRNRFSLGVNTQF